jgi:hypothetical protein
MRRREFAYKKRLKDLEDEYMSEIITPDLKGVPGAEYFERLGKDTMLKIFAKLYPIALGEADLYGIDTKGKNMIQIVKEWLKAKYDKENKDMHDVLEDLNMLEEVSEMIRGAYA